MHRCTGLAVLSHACARLLRQPFLAPSAKHGKRRSPRREPRRLHPSMESVDSPLKSQVDLSGTGESIDSSTERFLTPSDFVINITSPEWFFRQERPNLFFRFRGRNKVLQPFSLNDCEGCRRAPPGTNLGELRRLHLFKYPWVNRLNPRLNCAQLR